MHSLYLQTLIYWDNFTFAFWFYRTRGLNSAAPGSCLQYGIIYLRHIKAFLLCRLFRRHFKAMFRWVGNVHNCITFMHMAHSLLFLLTKSIGGTKGRIHSDKFSCRNRCWVVLLWIHWKCVQKKLGALSVSIPLWLEKCFAESEISLQAITKHFLGSKTSS